MSILPMPVNPSILPEDRYYDPDVFTEAEVTEAAKSFWTDIQKVRDLHRRLKDLVPYFGRDPEFDKGLREALLIQRKIMFDLRTAFGDAYQFLTEPQQIEAGQFIRTAQNELFNFYDKAGISYRLEGLGIAPVLIILGVAITALAAGALVGLHRNISLQEKKIKYQESLIPLVEAGTLPGDVLKPIEEPGFFDQIQNIAILGIAGIFLIPIIQKLAKGK